MTGQLMIIRHGFSSWNEKNLFTGWVDVDLTEQGISEAHRAGQAIAAASFSPDVLFTSVLIRAINTANIVTEELGVSDIETQRTWRLNERHYGALTGLDKKQTVEEYGEDQVALWRRSYDVAPPLVDEDSPYNFCHDPLYSDVPCSYVPRSECLKDVRERVVPYYEETIAPRLLKGDNVLIVAHGNSLRALMMELEDLTPEEIAACDLPTATPRLYEFGEKLDLVSARYVEDEETVSTRAQAVKSQSSRA